MLYIILGIAGLLVTVALFTFIFKRKNGTPEEIIAPEEGCCGAHAICEKGLKKLKNKPSISTTKNWTNLKELPLMPMPILR